jgi:hypothetical protein
VGSVQVSDRSHGVGGGANIFCLNNKVSDFSMTSNVIVDTRNRWKID